MSTPSTLFPVRRAVLAGVLGLVLSCSGTSQAPTIESTPQDEPPSTRVYVPRLEVAWSVGVDEAPAAPDDRMLYLAPASPVEGVDTDAVLRLVDIVGVGIRDYDYSVALKWPTGGLSVKASPAMSCHVTPGRGNLGTGRNSRCARLRVDQRSWLVLREVDRGRNPTSSTHRSPSPEPKHGRCSLVGTRSSSRPGEGP